MPLQKSLVQRDMIKYIGVEVKILINGKEIKLKDYPRRVIYYLILGYVNSLNLEEDPKEIEVYVKVREEDIRKS